MSHIYKNGFRYTCDCFSLRKKSEEHRFHVVKNGSSYQIIKSYYRISPGTKPGQIQESRVKGPELVFEISPWKKDKTRFVNIKRYRSKFKEELDVCKVLCNNCHNEIHSDVSFYELNKDEILEKSISIRENSKPLNRDIVGKMIDNGLSIKEMMSVLGCKKSAIYTMVKEISKKDSKNIKETKQF